MSKVRTTENEHFFTKRMFKELNIFDIQNLTLNKNRTKFLCALEAIEFERGEEFSLKELLKVFSPSEIFAKCLIAEELHIDFLILSYSNDKKTYEVHKIKRINKKYNITYKLEHISKEDLEIVTIKENMDEEMFINWWKEIKETVQTKPFVNGASARASKTLFDKVLARNGLLWGGNLDGFLILNNKVVAVIDNLSCSSGKLKDYNPIKSKYFSTIIFYANSLLAKQLGCPHYLFTINKLFPEKEEIGFAVIQKILHYKESKEVSFLNNKTPDKNVLKGIEIINKCISENLDATSPIIQKIWK